TVASAIEIATIAAVFIIAGWTIGFIGVTAAMLAVLGGRVAATLFLSRYSRRVVRSGGIAIANSTSTTSVSGA
nr:hypothetical protein [Gemmatimonadota bacterium]